MENNEVLKKIDELIIVEEQAVPVYSNHMKIIFKWSKISKENKAVIQNIFDKLISESKNHKLMLETVKKIFQSEA